MPLHTYLLFLPACFALNMVFGPNNVLSLSNGARIGVLHSVTASLERLVAFAIMIAITGFGLGALLLASATLFTVVKLGGPRISCGSGSAAPARIAPQAILPRCERKQNDWLATKHDAV